MRKYTQKVTGEDNVPGAKFHRHLLLQPNTTHSKSIYPWDVTSHNTKQWGSFARRWTSPQPLGRSRQPLQIKDIKTMFILFNLPSDPLQYNAWGFVGFWYVPNFQYFFLATQTKRTTCRWTRREMWCSEPYCPMPHASCLWHNPENRTGLGFLNEKKKVNGRHPSLSWVSPIHSI